MEFMFRLMLMQYLLCNESLSRNLKKIFPVKIVQIYMDIDKSKAFIYVLYTYKLLCLKIVFTALVM